MALFERTPDGTLNPDHRSLLIVSVVGGLALLASYAWAFGLHGEQLAAMWNGVPGWLRPVWTLWSFIALAGALALLYHLFSMDPENALVESPVQYWIFAPLLALVLGPWALWLPLTKAMLAAPGGGLWLAIRLCLWTAALASLGLLLMITVLRPRRPEGRRRLAVWGTIAIVIQTLLLDAILWTSLFDA